MPSLSNSGDNQASADRFDAHFTGQRECLLEFLKPSEVEARQIDVDDRLVMSGGARGAGNGHDGFTTM